MTHHFSMHEMLDKSIKELKKDIEPKREPVDPVVELARLRKSYEYLIAEQRDRDEEMRHLQKRLAGCVYWADVHPALAKYLRANKIDGKLDRSPECVMQFLRMLEYKHEPIDDSMCD